MPRDSAGLQRRARFWSSSKLALLFCLLAVVACNGRGCGGCNDRYLAELTQPTGQVERDRAGSEGQWNQSEVGARFRLGDGLRTGMGSTALLAMQPAGEVLVEENTTIRFEQEAGGDAQRLDIEAGGVEVETESVELLVQSPQGLTRVAAGSRVRVQSGDGEPTIVRVEAGRAVIEQSGEARTLTAGEQLELVAGAALIESAETHPEQQEERSTQEEQTKAKGTSHLSKSGPFEVLVGSGETATIHDASPPTVVGIGIDCDEGGLVEVARHRGPFNYARGRGVEHASMRLRPGSYRYRVRCLVDGKAQRRPRATGRVRVVTDTATRRLPAKAQRVSVDADGRNYRIQYSNRLPRFTFSWRDAPAAEGYVLTVTRTGRPPIRKQSDMPRLVLPEGALGEGLHRYSWQTRDGSARSKPSSLQVTFENQGNTAYLARRLTPGESSGNLRLTGGALAQSRVSVNGEPVRLGPQGRFAAEIPKENSRHVVVRVAHPSNGVHYYLRRQ